MKSILALDQAVTVRREKALVHSGRKGPPGNWIAPPGNIGAAVEATKPLKPPVERSHQATRQVCRL